MTGDQAVTLDRLEKQMKTNSSELAATEDGKSISADTRRRAHSETASHIFTAQQLINELEERREYHRQQTIVLAEQIELVQQVRNNLFSQSRHYLEGK